MSVSGCQPTDDACAGYRAGNEGNEVAEFGFEDGVEVCVGADGGEAVGVCEGGEDADSVCDVLVSECCKA